MGTFWSQLCELGVHERQDTFIKRYVSITNQGSFVVSVFVFIIFLAGLFFFGWIPSLALVLASSFLWILPIVLNSLGKINTSRVMASVMLSLMSLGISVVDKFDFITFLSD